MLNLQYSLVFFSLNNLVSDVAINQNTSQRSGWLIMEQKWKEELGEVNYIMASEYNLDVKGQFLVCQTRIY